MGCCMCMTDGNFTIKSENKIKAMEALHKLAKENQDLAWIDSDSVLRKKTFEETFEEFGWAVDTDELGNVDSIGFLWEKLGDENTFLQVIAPFVEKNSFIQMAGEDNAIWRWVFDGANCFEKSATITW